MKMKPLGTQVLLRITASRKSSTIDLSQCQTYPRFGVVKNKGGRVSPEVNIGDIVLFEPADLPIHGDTALLFIEERDIQAVIGPEILNELMDLGKEAV
jgi:co-chaperonin GroES (HSP10)